MNTRPGEDRLYTAIVMAFLVSLVVLGLLGVPAFLVAGVGVAVAAIGIACFHGFVEDRKRVVTRHLGGRRSVPTKYVPSVLEGSSTRRGRRLHLRRHRHASPPLRFR